jgi:hypothetical protein
MILTYIKAKKSDPCQSPRSVLRSFCGVVSLHVLHRSSSLLQAIQNQTATILFAVIPFVWLMAFAFSKSALACIRLCLRCVKVDDGGERQVDGPDEGKQDLAIAVKKSWSQGDKTSGNSFIRSPRVVGLAGGLKQLSANSLQAARIETTSMRTISGTYSRSTLEGRDSISLKATFRTKDNRRRTDNSYRNGKKFFSNKNTDNNHYTSNNNHNHNHNSNSTKIEKETTDGSASGFGAESTVLD